MQHHTGSFSGLHNTTIFTQRWLPDDAPRAVVLLSHGYGEHSGRYAHVAERMTARTYAVCALDHRGHGQSGGPRVTIDRFEDFVTDLTTYYRQVRADFPELPVFAYGHSMGSVITLSFAFQHQDELAGVITTGTAFKLIGTNPITVPLLKLMDRVVPRARLVPLTLDAISRDPSVIARYKADPLVNPGRIRVHLVTELRRAGRQCARRLPALRLPYLTLHGSADQLTSCAAVEAVLESCPGDDKTLKVYDGLFHEVHNAPERDIVIGDVLAWLDAHCP